MGLILLAFAWGLAEATLFFIVPDVLLSFIATRSRSTAFRAALAATIGALAGGAMLHTWGALDAPGARARMETIPGIDAALVTSARADVEQRGAGALFRAVVTGKPYKLFAVEMGSAGWTLLSFLGLSIAARFARFLVVPMAIGWIWSQLPPAWTRRQRDISLLACWGAFYAVYFYLHRS
jgi:membrane protein YqaA with SNARE-associated domain